MVSNLKIGQHFKWLSLLLILVLAFQFFAFPPKAAKAEAMVDFTGRGYGHGVGLSMMSVYFMSKNDPTYSQEGGYQNIIHYFYKGVAIDGFDPTYSDDNQVLVEHPDGTMVWKTMRDYLQHLAEEPDSWPKEGLRTTMVTARTYGWYKYEQNGYIPKGGQAHNPSINPSTRPNIVQAIQDTSNQVIKYNGNIIVAAYSSSSGGYTARLEDIWSPNTFQYYPYAERVPSPWDAQGSHYNWTKSVPTSVIESNYPQIGSFKGLQVLSRSGYGDWGGRVLRIRILGSSQNIEISGWDLRTTLGLKSNLFTFSYNFSHTALYNILSSRGLAMGRAWDSGIGNWVYQASKMVVGDFNDDGLDDIAIMYNYGNSMSRLWVFTNNGSGGFNSPALWWSSTAGAWSQPNSKLAVGDFDGDGKDDILAFYGYESTRQTKAWVFTSSGTSFRSPTAWWDSGPNNWDWVGSKTEVGDFNGDGKDDILAFYGYSTTRQTKAWVFNSNGSRFNSPTKWWDSGSNNWDWAGSKVVVGNFDGSNGDDILVVYGYSTTRQTKAWVFTSRGNRFNFPAAWWSSGVNNWDWEGSKTEVGDFNGDGKSDLIIFYNYNGARTIGWLFKSNGLSMNYPVVHWDSGAGNWEWQRSLFVTGKFDTDNLTDVAALYNHGS